MKDIETLKADLLQWAEWAEENIWEVPVTLPDDIKEAVAWITELFNQVKGDCTHCKFYDNFNQASPCWHCSRFAAKELVTGDYWEWDAPQKFQEVQNG